jgi:hypothetical protein
VNPLRVAFDARSLTSLTVRGWDRYTIGLVRALKLRAVEVTLLCRAAAPPHEMHVAAMACPVVGLADHGGLWWEQIALPLALRRGGFDLYHAPAEHGVPLFSPCPTVMTLHSATNHSYADLIRTGQLAGTLRDYLGHDTDPHRATPGNVYWRAQVRSARHLIAPSQFTRDEIVRLIGIAEARVTAVPLAVDDLFRIQPPDADRQRVVLDRLGLRQPYLLYVGGYETHKNIVGLLNAFALVRTTKPDLDLVLVGSGPAHDGLLAHAAGLGLQPGHDVHFLSALGPELPDLCDGAELFVSLSWRESFPLSFLEAMTRGLAVVASAWGGGTEVVGDSGSLVDPRDAEAFREAVLRLLADPRRGERARAAAARFSWDATARQTLAVYRRLLRG